MISTKAAANPAVRPIAIGDIWRRLPGKIAMMLLETVAAIKQLQPHQMGVSCPRATEDIPMLVQEVVRSLELTHKEGTG